MAHQGRPPSLRRPWFLETEMPNACGETREFKLRQHGILHCDYCGSISVEDAIKYLKQPKTHFSGSDWKYGWPHKFYIEPINPDANKLVEIGSSTSPEVTVRAGTGPNDRWRCFAHHNDTCGCPRENGVTGYWYEAIMGHHKSLYLKFYNKHLLDATPEQLKQFSELSTKIFGISFDVKDGKLFYVSPKTSSFYGYQRAGIISESGEPVHRF